LRLRGVIVVLWGPRPEGSNYAAGSPLSPRL
jgi:hypothetical protein